MQLEQGDVVSVRVKWFENTGSVQVYRDNNQAQFSGFLVSDPQDTGHPRLVWEAHGTGGSADGRLYLEFPLMNGKTMTVVDGNDTSDLRFALKPLTATPSFAY